MSVKGNDPIWLIKSGDRILGPYSLEMLKAKLLEKEFVVIDEVITPGKRWRYIREEPLLAKIVEEVRKGQANQREDTELGTMSMTQSPTNTTEITAEIDWQRTNPAMKVPEPPSDMAMIQDAEIVSEQDYSKANAGSASSVRQYGFGQDQKVQSDIARSSRMIWIGTAVALVFIAWYIMRVQSGSSGKPRSSDFPKIYEQAVIAERSGNFDLALKKITEARSLRVNDPDVDLLYATLKLHESDSNTLEAKTVLEENLKFDQRPDFLKRAHTAYGLAFLLEDDPRNARASFEKALSLDNRYFPAAFNRGVALFKERNYEEAGVVFRELFGQTRNPAALLHWARSEVRRSDLRKSVGKMDGILAAHERIFQKGADFRQEGLLVQMYLKVMSTNSADGLRHLNEFLMTDPYQTKEHYHDPLLDLRALDWKEFKTVCRELDEKSPRFRPALALCLIKAGTTSHLEAKKILEDLMQKSPEDALYKSLYALLNLEMKNDEEAKASLNLAETYGGTELSHILNARLCMQNNSIDCANKHWALLIGRRVPVLSALAGKAMVAVQQNDTQFAREWMAQIREVSPNYIPLLELQNQIEGDSK